MGSAASAGRAAGYDASRYGPARGAEHRRVTEYGPLWSQHRFHSLDARVVGFSGPVGSGKTAAFVQHALLLAHLNAGLPGVVGAPTYRLLADVTRADFLDACLVNDIPHRLNKSENSVYLAEPGSTVLFRSMDQPERLRGVNAAWVGCDELTYCKEASWDRLLGRLRHRRAIRQQAFAVWTPKGHDWVWRRFLSGKKISSYQCVLAKPGENKRNLAPNYYETLRESYNERFFRQEVLGEYLPQFSGQAYFNFDRAGNVAPVEFDRRSPLCWSLDFNIDPACSILAQVRDVSDEFDLAAGRRRRIGYVLGELALHDVRTAEVARAFLARIQPYLKAGLREIRVYGDATAKSKQRQTLESDWDVVRQVLGSGVPEGVRVVYDYATGNSTVRDRVTDVCSALLSASGDRRLFIDPSCTELIDDLEMVAWRTDAHGNVQAELDNRDPQRTHSSDALGYWVQEALGRVGYGPQSGRLIY